MSEIKRIETDLHSFRLEGEIIYGYVKPCLPTLEGFQESFDALKKLSGKKKVLLLLDPTDAVALNAEQRAAAMGGFSEHIRAAAIINNNFLVPLVFKLMKSRFKHLSFEMKLFKKKEKALAWLETFIPADK